MGWTPLNTSIIQPHTIPHNPTHAVQDLLFQGTFDMAKMRSQQEGKWLMLNINANDEFDSHRLNRDTWSHEALKEMLKGMFLFYQVYEK